MRHALVVMLLALGLVSVGCEGEPGREPGSELGPCRSNGTCDPGLQCLSDICVAEVDAGPVGIDAGPVVDGGLADADLEVARAYFESDVAPILAARCDACHVAGTGGAPAFGSSYDSYIAYISGGGSLVGCTATQSTLFTEGAHAAGAGPALTTAENMTVRTFIDLFATVTPGCGALIGARPSTGSLVSQADMYLLDLSTLGAGLQNATATFTVGVDVGGLQITGLTLTAGPNGLTAVGPELESCLQGTAMPTAEFRDLHIVLAPNASALVGDGTLALPGTIVGDRMSLRFAALLPSAGAMGPPTDNRGACLP